MNSVSKFSLPPVVFISIDLLAYSLNTRDNIISRFIWTSFFYTTEKHRNTQNTNILGMQQQVNISLQGNLNYIYCNKRQEVIIKFCSFNNLAGIYAYFIFSKINLYTLPVLFFIKLEQQSLFVLLKD